ncbi:hypothetical protein N9L90_00895 [Planctomycetota bacterium]|nr:hypothetical protein [Planctomycetota bacterium]
MSGPWQATFEKSCLRALFAGFASRAIQYAVLRNFHALPDSVGGRDIDILVAPNDLAGAIGVLQDIADGSDLVAANWFEDERIHQVTFVKWSETGSIAQIKIDLFTSGQLYGLEYLTPSRALAGAQEHRGVSVVAPHVVILDKWIFHLLVGQRLDPKYDAEFGAIAGQAEDSLISGLAPVFGTARAADLVKELVRCEGSSVKLSKFVRVAGFARLMLRKPLRSILNVTRFLGFRIKDRWRPHGLLVSISGPDGCGKTTVIEQLLEDLAVIFGEDVVTYHHFRPSVLPRIASLAKRAGVIESVDENYEIPHRAEPSGLIGSMVRLGYYALDYTIGYWRRIRPRRQRREIVVYDRYHFELVADPARSRIRLPNWLLLRAIRCLPRPGLAFYIKVDDEEVYRRKQELEPTRITELNRRYWLMADAGILEAVCNDRAPGIAAREILNTIVLSQGRGFAHALRGRSSRNTRGGA